MTVNLNLKVNTTMRMLRSFGMTCWVILATSLFSGSDCWSRGRKGIERKILPANSVFVKKRIRLGYEVEGVQIALVNIRPTSDPIEQNLRFRAWRGIRANSIKEFSYVNRKNSILIKDLSSLKGLCQIKTSHDALRTVRLKTSLSTWYIWPPGPEEVEIVSSDNQPHLPNFGIEGFGHVVNSSGLLGVLSREAYRKGGFMPPEVKRVDQNFVIVRWIFSSSWNPKTRNIDESIQQIREVVGPRAEYSRTILSRSAPPSLPKTNWSLLIFM